MMWPPESVKTTSTPACLSARAASFPPWTGMGEPPRWNATSLTQTMPRRLGRCTVRAPGEAGAGRAGASAPWLARCAQPSTASVAAERVVSLRYLLRSTSAPAPARPASPGHHSCQLCARPARRFLKDETGAGRGPAPVRLESRSLRLADRAELVAAVPLPGRLVVTLHRRLALAEAHGVDARSRDAAVDQVLLHGVGAALGEREVVLLGATLVRVAFDHDGLPVLVLVDRRQVGLERRTLVGTDRGAVEVEVDGLEPGRLLLGRLHVARARGGLAEACLLDLLRVATAR